MGVFFVSCMMLMWILCALTPPTVPIENHILYILCTLSQDEREAGGDVSPKLSLLRCSFIELHKNKQI